MSNPSEKEEPRTVQVATVVWGLILIANSPGAFTLTPVDMSGGAPGVVVAWALHAIGVLAIVGGLVGALFRRH